MLKGFSLSLSHTHPPPSPATFLVMSLAPDGGGATLTTGLRGAKPAEHLRANGHFLLQPEGSAHKTSGGHVPRHASLRHPGPWGPDMGPLTGEWSNRKPAEDE